MKYKYVTNQTFFISINISLTDTRTLEYQTELEQSPPAVPMPSYIYFVDM